MGKSKRNKPKSTSYANPTGVGARRVVNSGYGDFGASHTRNTFANFTARSDSPSRDIYRSLPTLRSRARSLFMSAPVATSAIKSLRTAVVGRGLHLNIAVDHAELGMTEAEAVEWARNTEREFAVWAENPAACDILGQHDFYELQQLALLSWKMSGDSFCLFRNVPSTPLVPYSLRLQLLEADRISTPNDCIGDGLLAYGETRDGNRIYSGVEVDKTGRIVAYHIASDYPCNGDVVEWRRVAKYGAKTGAPNILHLMDAERPGQLRGVPFIAPALESIMQLAQYLRTEALAALMETYLSGYITTSQADAPIIGSPHGRGGAGIVVDDADSEGGEDVRRDLEALEPEPGKISQLLPGESITFNDPKRPGTQFDPFVRSVAMQIGAALEIPADVLLKSYNSSYSASRAAIQDFWRMVSMTRDWFASDFCGAVYAEWLAEAIDKGRISAPGFFTDPRRRKAWLGHEWTGAAMPHLDPVKEASAMEKMTAHGWLTNQQATTLLNGGDWNANIAQLEGEAVKLSVVQDILGAAAKIKSESPIPAHDHADAAE